MIDADRDPEASPSAEGGGPDPADVESAGRSCLVILLLLVAVGVLLCVGLGARWAFG